MKTFLAVIIIALLGFGAYWYWQNMLTATTAVTPPVTEVPATSTPPVVDKTKTVLGKSVDGSDITAYHFGALEAIGTTTKEILFVGGIHGGYEWNTSLVAYELMDYLKANPSAIPANVKVTVIPVLNPDGLKKVVSVEGKFAAADVNTDKETQVAGRFNGNTVDLNRNFDCDWKESGVWQSKKVSGGSEAFSEPESAAVKTYIDAHTLAAAVIWYSSAGGVYSSNCHDGVLAETTELTKLYAKASGYPAHEVWDYYEITGDMANWLSKIKVPTISVLLTNHTDTEWTKNQKGVDAVLKHYAL